MNWELTNNKLYKKFTFKTFNQAIQFMQLSSIGIDKLDHHPEWKNVYNSVEVWLCTHSKNNTVTEKDYELASILDKVFLEHFS
jgi:4a-hydroxytetrahydrobiopterin dehydratase